MSDGIFDLFGKLKPEYALKYLITGVVSSGVVLLIDIYTNKDIFISKLED